MNKLLIVEDDANDMALLLRVLRGCPLEIFKCATAPQARALFYKHHFHAALINLTLPYPEPDGVELVRWLRARSPQLLIHIVTGAEDPRRRAQAIEAGAQDFFTKPYTSDDNKLLLGQLQATRAAYRRGKRMMHKRTTFWAAIANIGDGIIGLSLLPSLTSMKAAENLYWVIVTGYIIRIVGQQMHGSSAADKRVVERNLQEQRDINREELGLEPPEKKP